MEQSCARAVELGLASIAFTEHADFTRCVIEPASKTQMRPLDAARVGPGGHFSAPPLDVEGYLACVQRCRDRFRGLRILSGMELGEPHWHEGEVDVLLRIGGIDRLLGSVHSLAVDGPRMVSHLFGRLELADLMRSYLGEVFKLADSSAPFAVLAHIDYPVRYWPPAAGSFDATIFEDEYRTVLGALARSGRALELNTTVPLPAVIVQWWYQAGGEALTFGSDAHRPSVVAGGFSSAAALAETCGFHPGRYPDDLWRRSLSL
jgi:histidinol-phosphatase (PHP family)